MSRYADREAHTAAGYAADRGSIGPYIIGFVLSLLFTIIPYCLVAGQLVTGTALLVLILTVAAIQMIIQVLFFLHLGRERKPQWQRYFFVGTIVGIVTVVAGSIYIMSNLHTNMSPQQAAQKLAQDEGIAQVEGGRTGACPTIRNKYLVTIKNGVASPASIKANTCDAIIFTTEDAVTRDIAFGTYPDQAPYAGQTELTITQNRGQMLILSQTGTYQYYDYLNPGVTGAFTVTR